MAKRRNKVQLSPQLKLGVGRGQFKNNVFKYTGFAFLTLSLVLVVWTVTVVIRHASQPTSNGSNPQVLGDTDTQTDPFITYTVQQGDTVFNIAQKYKLNWATLATINNLSSPFILKSGQELKIPNQ